MRIDKVVIVTPAKFEICRELYYLTGWENTGLFYCQAGPNREVHGQQCGKGLVIYDEDVGDLSHKNEWPHFVAYDLGYLMRHLPRGIIVYAGKRFYSANTGNLYMGDHQERWYERADTPEDALAKLAIQLVKRGLLEHK